MIFWLLACRPDIVLDPGAPPPVPSGDTATVSDRPVLRSPAEAVDLDPAPDVVSVALEAAPHRFEVHGVEIDGWAYDAQVPGPTIRARVGDRVEVAFTNALPEPTTVHWHGVGVPADMDGAGWPMPAVAPGGSFRYVFVVDRPGTFWYHPHLDTDHQVDRGLYGVVVVEDPAEPSTPDLVVVLDTFGEPALADPHLDARPGTWAANGLVDPVFPVAGGTVVRVRMLNASNAGYVALPDERVIARDQGLLAAAEDGVVLGPGDRAELEWRVGEDFDVVRVPYAVGGGVAFGDPERLVEVVADPPASTPEAPVRAHSGAPPTADPGTTDLRFLLTGSVEGGWEMNGETFPEVTVPRLALGQEVWIEVRNASPAHHPFHVHGHTFEVGSVNGLPSAFRTIEDTIDVPIGALVRLRLTADNPGTWMTHCHVLPHAEGGMMTLLTVE